MSDRTRLSEAVALLRRLHEYTPYDGEPVTAPYELECAWTDARAFLSRVDGKAGA